jgi:hypothetical protein
MYRHVRMADTNTLYRVPFTRSQTIDSTALRLFNEKARLPAHANLMKKTGFQRCRLYFPEDRWQGSPPQSAKAHKFHHAGHAIFDTIAFPNEKEQFNENATGHRPRPRTHLISRRR